MRTTKQRAALLTLVLGQAGGTLKAAPGYAWKVVPYTATEMRNRKPHGRRAHVQLMLKVAPK